MPEAGSFFISSINGRVTFPFTGIYNASKHATEAVADCLRVELSHFVVQVGLVERASSTPTLA